MAFNPNAYNPSAAGARKTFEAGQIFARISDIRFDQPAWVKNDGLYVVVTLLGPDLGEEFEGFEIDKNDPGAGRYPGVIANVRNGSFAFSTFTYNQKTIERDDQVQQYLEDLTNQMGKLEALKVEYNRLAADHLKRNPKGPGFDIDTLEDYLQLVKSVVVDPDNYGLFALQTEPYKNKEGYLRDSFLFPKKAKEGTVLKYPFAQAKSAEEQPASLLVPSTYVIEKTPKAAPAAVAVNGGSAAAATPVQGFGGQTQTSGGPVAGDDDGDLPF